WSQKVVKQWFRRSRLILVVLQNDTFTLIVLGDVAPVVEQVLCTFLDPPPQVLSVMRMQVHGVPVGAFCQGIYHRIQLQALFQNLLGSKRRRHRFEALSRQADERRSQTLIKSARRERSNTCCFYAAIERLVVIEETLVMRAVPRLMYVQDR